MNKNNILPKLHEFWREIIGFSHRTQKLLLSRAKYNAWIQLRNAYKYTNIRKEKC